MCLALITFMKRNWFLFPGVNFSVLIYGMQFSFWYSLISVSNLHKSLVIFNSLLFVQQVWSCSYLFMFVPDSNEMKLLWKFTMSLHCCLTAPKHEYTINLPNTYFQVLYKKICLGSKEFMPWMVFENFCEFLYNFVEFGKKTYISRVSQKYRPCA